jgi:hypothetical protein
MKLPWLRELKIGDKFFNHDRNWIATVERMGSDNVYYRWDKIDGTDYMLHCKMPFDYDFIGTMWHLPTELEKVLL